MSQVFVIELSGNAFSLVTMNDVYRSTRGGLIVSMFHRRGMRFTRTEYEGGIRRGEVT